MRAFLPFALILAVAACNRQPEATPEANQSADSSAWSGPGATAPVAGQGSLPAGKLDRSHKGEAAPDIAFQDAEGGSVGIGHFAGRPVLVNLWATWCGPCITEMPTIDALAGREGYKLQILAVSQDSGEGARDKVGSYFNQQRFKNLQPYLDSKMEMMSALKIEVLPTTILYGADGREVWRMTGIEDWESEDAAKLLAEAS